MYVVRRESAGASTTTATKGNQGKEKNSGTGRIAQWMRLISKDYKECPFKPKTGKTRVAVNWLTISCHRRAMPFTRTFAFFPGFWMGFPKSKGSEKSEREKIRLFDLLSSPASFTKRDSCLSSLTSNKQKSRLFFNFKPVNDSCMQRFEAFHACCKTFFVCVPFQSFSDADKKYISCANVSPSLLDTDFSGNNVFVCSGWSKY